MRSGVLNVRRSFDDDDTVLGSQRTDRDSVDVCRNGGEKINEGGARCHCFEPERSEFPWGQDEGPGQEDRVEELPCSRRFLLRLERRLKAWVQVARSLDRFMEIQNVRIELKDDVVVGDEVCLGVDPEPKLNLLRRLD
jgi:hypothetical protein